MSVNKNKEICVKIIIKENLPYQRIFWIIFKGQNN